MTSPQPGAELQPNPDQVNEFHRYSDLDNSPEAGHHTLGIDPNQAASGDHDHDGRNSAFLSPNSHSHVPESSEFLLVSTLTAQSFGAAFTTIKFETVNVDEGNWNATDNHYVVPVDGLYYCRVSCRMTENSTVTFAIGVFTSNADGHHSHWQKCTGVRTTGFAETVHRVTAGQRLRAYIYSDAALGISSGELKIYRVRSF